MHLNDNLKKQYTEDQMSAIEAQRLAQIYAFGPVMFQVARIMVKWGIFEMLNGTPATPEEVAEKAGISVYAAKCLLESSLTMRTVTLDLETGKYSLAKAGWFLVHDESTRVNMDFNHDVNYQGMFYLEDALREGKPAGLKCLGDWPTVYEGLSSLPEQAQKSWFAFDHFYSDGSFEQALQLVFSRPTRRLMDVGGNTGRWAMQCVRHNPDVEVTIVDLPQQLGMMREQTAGQPGADRIHGYAANMLDDKCKLPCDQPFDAIWMSQFLDCFSEEEIVSILRRAAEVMTPDTHLYIMETLWDRQRFDTAALCLTQISLYFTAIANGNSKMYHSDDLVRLVEKAGLHVEAIHDFLGLGHSVLECTIR
ncbi:MAG: methyltransferase domain-containing protein [Bacteroidales bacterium]|nr:methyltransferase domain-containing protein [Bacteroidales bacterium]